MATTAHAPERNTAQSIRWAAWAGPLLLPLGALVAFLGYVGPWVDHRVAGLAILGLDLGEYVKFLPAVRAGATSLWREGFYLPLVAISLTLSLCTWRPDLRWPPARRPSVAWRAGYARGDDSTRSPAPTFGRNSLTRSLLHWLLLAIQVIVSIVAALNLLPPAWTPQRMMTPEFQQQAAALAFCLIAAAFGPFLALLPRRLAGALLLLLCLLAAVVPVQQFLRVLSEIAGLYNHPLTPGWGMYMMLLGLLLLALLGGWLLVSRDYQDSKAEQD